MTGENKLAISRDEIATKVIEVLAREAGTTPSHLSEGDRLWQDLGIGTKARELIAPHYSKISQSYPGGKAIKMSEAGAFKIIKDAIDLVL